MSFKWYKDNLKRVVLTLGMTLFVAAALGVAAEEWLRSTEAAVHRDRAIELSQLAHEIWLYGAKAPSTGYPVYLPLGIRQYSAGPVSFWASFSLALASVRIVLPIIGALVAIPLLASSLFHKLHATKDLKEAHDTLHRIIFGQLGFGPYLLVKEGKIASGEDTPVARIGGPASLVIYNDTAVVTEQYGRIKRVLGVGFAQLERFEKVWETIDLRPQRWVYEVFALTKEGIPISCEADISFKIDDRFRDAQGREQTKTPTSEVPYPYTEEAVLRAATSKLIREPKHKDSRMAWTGRVVIGFTEGTLRNILAEYRLDWLIAPPQPGQQHPREKIRRRLEEELQAKVGAVGAKILKVELGEIQVKARDEETAQQLSAIVSRQWVEAWHADWEARALASRVEGEAELLRMDMARIQAQAEMVVTLTEALQSTIVSHGRIEPYILALRFVEALRWMSYNTLTREFMPPEAMLTLKRLQALLGAEAGMHGEQRQNSQPPEGV